MAGTFKVLGLLLHKNFLVRRRQWIASLIGEFLVPVGLIVCLWAIRNFSANAPVRIDNSTIYNVTSQKDIMLQGMSFRTMDVYFTPNNDFTRTLMKDTVKCTHLNKGNLLGYSTEGEVLKEYLKYENDSIAIIFDDENVSDETKHLKYKIRTRNLEITNLYITYTYGLDYDILYYFVNYNPVLPFQMCIDETFIQKKLNDPTFSLQYSLQQMPYPPYTKHDSSDTTYRQMFTIFIVIAFMIPLFIETSKATNEKFLGINVLMSMNGVSNALNLFSWLAGGVIFISISCVLPITAILLVTTDDALPYLYYGNPVIIWLVLTFFVAHLLTFGVHVSAYFSRSLLVMFALLVLNVCAQILQTYGFKEEDYPIAPYLGILFPNMLLFRAWEELNYYESISEGIQWRNLFVVGNSAYKIGGSTGMILILSIIGIIFHFTMAIYIYAINPGKYGVKKHPLFFLKTKKKSESSINVENVEYNGVDGKPFESIPKGLYTPGIQIRNLMKSYNINLVNRTKVHALRGVSMDFYKGQITSLLGHNGAGKTTIMSILTGMISPTDGQVLVNSKDIKYHIREIMNDMGLCTQENMLFPSLTVSEQLTFFAMLKGKNKTKAAIKQDVKAFLEKLKLYEKRHVLPKNLSGGQKRRVCLGMALIGDPNILILDEPTSGLDPESRRVIWDILLKMRGQKTILISTHDMEEADILGDRIAILHTGQLRSYGSSMFLKKLLGKGNVEITLSVKPSHDPERIRSVLNCQGEIVNEDGSKLVLSIPNSPDLPDALDNIERKKQELGISGLSVSLISLEQVFLKLTLEQDDPSKLGKSFVNVQQKLTGGALFMQSLRALFSKKMTYTLKNMSTILIMLILILVALSVISLILKETDVTKQSMPVMPMNLDIYNSPETFYTSKVEAFGQKYKSVTESFNGKAMAVEQSNINEGLLSYAKRDLSFYDNHVIAAAEFNGTKQKVSANALYSKKATFSILISVNLLSNAILKGLLDDDYSISISIQTLPSANNLRVTDTTVVNAFTTTVTFAFIFFAVFALFVLHPLRESSTNVKQLQQITGISCYMYWGTMFVFDLIIYLLIVAVIIAGLITMDKVLELKIYQEEEILFLLFSFVIFAINGLPLVYSFSFVKLNPSAVVRTLVYVPIGLVSIELIMYTVNQTLGLVYDFVRILRQIQKPIFLLTPYVSFFHGQLSFYVTAQKNSRCKRMPNVFYDTVCSSTPDPDYQQDYCCLLKCYNGECKRYFKYFNDFEEDISLEESLIYLAATPLLYFGILIVVENQVIQKLIARIKKTNLPKNFVDEQVRREKAFVAQRISELSGHNLSDVSIANGKAENNYMRFRGKNPGNTGKTNGPVFLVHELRKQYKKLLAVQDVTFSVNQSECFGLLGVNGAGKSTTFRMMTGGEVPDNGVMYIGDKDFNNNRRHYLSQMGYCPQNDAIIRSLNAYDHLRLFARLRGIPEDQVEAEVKMWIDRLNLNASASQPSGTYSGGNKRRLNIAIALIGIPNLVLMDEPTTGVDPGARRSLWNVIQSCQITGQAVVLTSHSMEECEALCNRLAIMVDGRLVCIGPSQELKQRFGTGYDIPIKLNPEKARTQIDDIKKDMARSLNGELVDGNLGYLMYHVTPNYTTWRKMYDVMNEMKSKYNSIDDYSVLSSTLEQLFLLFARAAGNDPRRKTD